jgi:hypothetical protein
MWSFGDLRRLGLLKLGEKILGILRLRLSSQFFIVGGNSAAGVGSW